MRLAVLLIWAIAAISRASDFQVRWSAPTNSWPERLWIYKVVPQQYSPAAVFNMMSFGSFTTKDRKKAPPYFREKDPETMFFGELDGNKKYLAISDRLGFIEFHDGIAASSSQLKPILGVPGENEAVALGLRCLQSMAIDRNDIATKLGSDAPNVHWQNQTLGYIDATNKSEITLTNMMGVIFNRRMDGISVGGVGLWGGAKIMFGNNGKIADMQVCWRNLQPLSLESCPTAQEIVQWISDRKITLRRIGSKTALATDAVTELNITQAVPYFDGKYIDEPMTVVYPYLDCRAEAVDVTGTNAVWFQCPLTPSKDNWQIIK